MEKNIYDNTAFFQKYRDMLRSREGLKGAGEWPVLEKMLPDFKGKRVLDLGCGYGWHCRYAAERGAVRVVGIDSSEKMLQEARYRNSSDVIVYRQAGIEDFDYPPESFDVAISSLALHYVENLKDIFCKIHRTLIPDGIFVFTIEHPVFTAYGSQEWFRNAEGIIQHWPVDHYFTEGRRETGFLGEKVVKYHHTLTTLLQGLLQTGFAIQNVAEPQPTPDMLKTIPEMSEELRRPMMIAIAAVKCSDR